MDRTDSIVWMLMKCYEIGAAGLRLVRLWFWNQLDFKDVRPQLDMAAHNGHLTKSEQRQLNREQNCTSRQIYKDKHDGK